MAPQQTGTAQQPADPAQAARVALARLERPAHIADELPRAELTGISGVTPLQAQLLANRGARGLQAARDLLTADWRGARALPNLSEAIQRLERAIAAQEPIVVYGDHDCDGITSCAVMTLALRALATHVTPYIPRRDDDGRGLNDDAVRQLASDGARLIVTTDCGSANVTEVALARSLGVDVIITDHHPIHGETPSDCLIVNPRLAAERTPSDDLPGAGVAFRLAEGLLRALAPERAESLLEDLLDLVAVGVIGDIVPLTRESWSLARVGLERLRANPRPGLRALLDHAEVNWRQLTERDITYVIAPRLNAAARLGQPMTAVELLLAGDRATAEHIASQLEGLNQERQRVTEEIMALAEEQVATQLALEQQPLPDGAEAAPQAPLISAVGDGWPLGMLGLVASRLAERLQRAAVVISRDGEEARGSARAPEGMDLGEALAARADAFRRFGGHARAAGFTLPSAEIDGLLTHLRQHLGEQVAARALSQAAGADPIAVDLRLPLNRLLARIYHEQQALAPFGPGFPEPVYISLGVRVIGCWRSGVEGRNLRLRVRDATTDRVFFWARQGELCDTLRASLGDLPMMDLIYTLDAFTRNGGDLDLLPRILAVRIVE